MTSFIALFTLYGPWRTPMPVSARSKAWACRPLPAGTAGSSLVGLECISFCECFARQKSLRRADNSSRRVLTRVVCLSIIVKPRQWGSRGRLRVVAPWRTWLFRLILMNSKTGCDIENTSVIRIYTLWRKILLWAGIAKLVERLATGWTLRSSNPGGSDIFRTRPDWC